MHHVLSRLCCELFFFQAEDGIRDSSVTGVQTCALPIWCAQPGCSASRAGGRGGGGGGGGPGRVGGRRGGGKGGFRWAPEYLKKKTLRQRREMAKLCRLMKDVQWSMSIETVTLILFLSWL